MQVKALRSLLAQATEAEQGADLFHSLYSSWSHSAGAILSLCFLAGANSIFVGGRLLTTPLPGEDADAALISDLGLRPVQDLRPAS